MTPEDFEKIRELFLTARGLDPRERSAYLDRACANRADLRSEVAAMLEQVDTPRNKQLEAGLLEATPVIDKLRSDVEQALSVGVEPEPLPEKIGRYTILDRLGEGGMGIVYLAEQEDPRRRVALKVIHAALGGSPGRGMVRRFRQEAQLLGRLQHPCIAQVYEASTATLGHRNVPFFAMEYVDGEPLTRYAETRPLNTRQRLELFLHVCEAVQHAHQKGIIHRDLKPANILVSAAGQPKILDFGVARATNADVHATTAATEVGQLIGTLAYMSPEQMAGDPENLDTRSDVYALGVVLYELLTGRMLHDLTNKTVPEAARVIREDDPVPLTGNGGTTATDKAFRGDLETIIAKALEKDLDRRYASAADLAADVRRHLADEPIAARPASAIYQFRKFARRNRPLVHGVVAAFVVLVLGVIGTSIGMARARQAEKLAGDRLIEAQDARTDAEEARAEAERESDSLKATKRFFANHVIEEAFPWRTGPDVTVMEALDRAVPKIEGIFEDHPATEANIRHYVGNIYQELARYEDAETQLVAAMEKWETSIGRDSRGASATEYWMVKLLRRQGRFDEAERLCREVLEIRRGLFNEGHAWINEAKRMLAEILHDRGAEEEAIALLYDALEAAQVGEDVRSANVGVMLGVLTQILRSVGRAEEGADLHTRRVERLRQMLGEDHSAIFHAIGAQVRFARGCGRLAEAEALCRPMIEVARRLWGDEDHRTLDTQGYLANVLFDRGKAAEAEPIFTYVLAARERTQGMTHVSTFAARADLSELWFAAGAFDKAELMARETLARKREALGKEHPLTHREMLHVADILRSTQQGDEAEALIRECLDTRRSVWGPVDWRTVVAIDALVDLLVHEQREDEAIAVYRKALVEQRVRGRDDYPETVGALENFAALLERVGQQEEALALRHEILIIHARVSGEDHPRTVDAAERLADMDVAPQRFEDAEP